MSTVAVQPFSGTYRALPAPSTFAFAVRHSGVFWYRGSLSDVAATLRGDGDGAGARGVGARRLHLGRRASRDAGERARAPGGGNAVGWDVDLEIDLLLIRDEAETEGR